MKKLLLSTALAAAATTVPAFAQDAENPFRAEADPMEVHASEFIGMRVYRAEGADADAYEGIQEGWDDIGEINDVILSRDGNVEAVLVDIGGFLGMGENQVAVDMDSVRFVSDDSTTDNASDFFLVLNAPRTALEEAPTYKTSDAHSDSAMSSGTEESAAAGTEATAETDTEMAAGTEATAETDTEMAADTEATAETDTEMAADTEATADTGEMADANDPSLGERLPIEREGYALAEEADLTAERLTGAPAYDANDEWIGEVSELILSDDGRVEAAIVDVGGFLGIGEKPVELPLTDIDILRADDGSDIRVYISMTEEQLEAMPDYEG